MADPTAPPTPPNLIPVSLTQAGQRGFQVRKIGLPRRRFSDVYHRLLNATWSELLGLIVGLYLAVNTLFAGLYLLDGDAIENARPHSFVDAFFFSVQTMATIGYGKMVPHTTFANILVTIEALLGLLGLALVTGLLFAKFSRPTARVLFSRVATFGVRDGVPSLMWRMANERGNQIVEAQLRASVARNESTQEGERVRRFYDLTLVRDRNVIFALTWTAVHPITPASPLYGATAESLREQGVQVIVSLMGIDDTFSQTVHVRHSYSLDDLVWKARLVDILSIDADGQRVIDYTRFHDTQPM